MLGTILIRAKNILIVIGVAVCCPNIFLQDFDIHFPSSWVYCCHQFLGEPLSSNWPEAEETALLKFKSLPAPTTRDSSYSI